MEEDKMKIIKLFLDCVKGKEIVIAKAHHGGEGHWLEKQMGIAHNGRNAPDLHGYEMKKQSKKITFGDFSASEYIFSAKKPHIISTNNWADDNIPVVSRVEFLRYFGCPNPKKHNRLSWSGRCVPKYGEYNTSGQMMKFDDNGHLSIYYSHAHDTRPTKDCLPDIFKTGEILIVVWMHNKLKKHIDDKFNQRGFFICNKVGTKYESISFGAPFDYAHFAEQLKNKNIIFDSGMYNGNTRNYSMFRSTAENFWSKLIVETHK